MRSRVIVVLLNYIDVLQKQNATLLHTRVLMPSLTANKLSNAADVLQSHEAELDDKDVITWLRMHVDIARRYD